MESPRTHLGIDPRLCGVPVALAPGRAAVALETLPEMAVDALGLVHGGFLFGAVDYAAMLAVNDPNVVLGSASCRFLAPLRVGQQVRCEARAVSEEGRKRRVEVVAKVGDQQVLTGELTCFVLAEHVLRASTKETKTSKKPAVEGKESV